MATEAASLFVTLSAKTDQYTKAMDSAQSRMAGFTGASTAQTKTVSDNFKKSSDTVHWWSRGVKKDTEDAAKDVEKGAKRQEVANRRIQESMKGAASGLVALTAAYAGFSFAKDAVKSTADLTDETWKLSSITHQSAKTASTWIETMKGLGVTADSTRTGFTTLSRQIAAAEGGSKTAGKAFQGMGINMSELKQGNFEKTLLDVSDALSHMTNKSQVAATAQLLFGRNTTALLPLLTGGKDKVLEALDATQKYGDYIGGDAFAKLKKFKDAQIDFGSAMSGVKIAFTTALLPYLTPAIKLVSQFINQLRTGKGPGGQFGDAISHIFNAVKTGVGWFVKFIGGVKEIVPALEAAGVALLIFTGGMQALDAIPEIAAFTAIAAGAFLIIKNWKTIKPFLEGVLKSVLAALEPLESKVKDVAKWFEDAGKKIDKAVGGWKGWIPILEAVGIGIGVVAVAIGAFTAAMALADLAVTAFGAIAAVVFSPITLAIVAIAAAAYLIIKNWNTVGPIFAAVWTGIKTGVTDATQWIITAFNNVVAFVVPIFKSIGDAFKPVITAIVQGVGSIVPLIVPYINAVIGVWEFFFNLLKTVAPIAFKVVTTALAPVIAIIKVAAGFVIPLIGKAFQTAWADIKVIMNAIAAVIKGGFQIIKGVIEFFTGLFTLNFKQMWQGIQDIFSGALKVLVGILKGAWQLFYNAGSFIINGIASGMKAAFHVAESLLNTFLNGILAPINVVLGVLGVKPIKVNIGGGGGSKSSGGSSGQVTTRAGTYATGGKVNKPGYFAGEQAPAHPEFILATNPAYRQRNLGLWAQAGGELGVPGFAMGGVPGEVQSFMGAAGFNNIAIAGMLGNAQQESTMNPNTPGGGLWQQITNFGQGTGGSLLHQMQVMLPQIMHLQSAMNNAGSPGHAASIFELGFEIADPRYVNMANRVGSAESFYAQLGGKGSKGIFSVLAGAAGDVIGASVDAVKAMLPSIPSIAGFVGDIPPFLLKKTVKFIEDNLNPFSGGGGTTGPKGLGMFDGKQVSNWIIPELKYARSHGWTGHITSGYRTEAHSAALGFPGDMHTKIAWPGGAVDFGGMSDPAGLANKLAFMRATRDYPGTRLVPAVGFHDDGHMSAQGHFMGGIEGIPGYYAGIKHTGSGYGNLGPKAKKHTAAKGPTSSIHWNWQTNSYQSMTSAAYKALQSAWYSQHPTLRMPSSPGTGKKAAKGKKAPGTSYHWDWQKQAYEQLTSQQYKTLQSTWYSKHPTKKMPTSAPARKTPTVDQLAVLLAKRKAMIPKGVNKLLAGWGKKESTEPAAFQTVRNLRQTEQNYIDSFNHMDFLPTDTATLEGGKWVMEPTDLTARMNRLTYLEDSFLTPAQSTLTQEGTATWKAIKAAQDKHAGLLKLKATIKKKIAAIKREIKKQTNILATELRAVTTAKTSKEKTQHAVKAQDARNRIADLTMALGSTTKGVTGSLNALTGKDSGMLGKYANTIPALTDSLVYFSDQSKIGDPNSKTPSPILGFLSIPDRQKTLTDLFTNVHQEMAAVSGTTVSTDNSAALALAQQQALALQAQNNVLQAQYKILGTPSIIAGQGLGALTSQSWGGFLGSFATGIANVPMQGLAELHKGEAVIPAAMNPFTNGSSGGNVHLHLHGDADKWVSHVEAVIDGKTADIVHAANNELGFRIGTARQTPMSPGRVARY